MEQKNVIKNRRTQLGLTQLEVAQYVGVSESTICRWESGNIENVGSTRLKKLAEILQLSPADLIIDDGSDTISVSKKRDTSRVTLDITDLTPENREKLKDYYDLLYNAQQTAPKVSTARKMA